MTSYGYTIESDGIQLLADSGLITLQGANAGPTFKVSSSQIVANNSGSTVTLNSGNMTATGVSTVDFTTTVDGVTSYTNIYGVQAVASRADSVATVDYVNNYVLSRVENDPDFYQAANCIITGANNGNPTSANVNLSSVPANGSVTDGVALAVGTRVLVAGQTTASQNGIYVVTSVSGGNAVLARATDLPANLKLTNALTVPVTYGLRWGGSVWQCNFLGTPFTVGTSAVTGQPDGTAVQNTIITIGTSNLAFTNITVASNSVQVRSVDFVITDASVVASGISADGNGDRIIDGINLADANAGLNSPVRVLIASADATKNGVYIVDASTYALSRADDFKFVAQATSPLRVYAKQGTAYRSTVWEYFPSTSTAITATGLLEGSGVSVTFAKILDPAVALYVDANAGLWKYADGDSTTGVNDGRNLRVQFNTSVPLYFGANASTGVQGGARFVYDGTKMALKDANNTEAFSYDNAGLLAFINGTQFIRRVETTITGGATTLALTNNVAVAGDSNATQGFMLKNGSEAHTINASTAVAGNLVLIRADVNFIDGATSRTVKAEALARLDSNGYITIVSSNTSALGTSANYKVGFVTNTTDAKTVDIYAFNTTYSTNTKVVAFVEYILAQ